ncbi:MAG: KilA-N domain-containing protein [Acetobacter orientalis]|uniref:KilA-N domain-containing protein n=1 Tax=Acetobacter orientalis TaxID=146474 RepID=UPI0039E79038
MTNNNTELTILSTTIRQDDQGRYCLNDCHKASGLDKKNGPSYWLATDQSQALIAELTDTGNPVSPVSVKRGGTNQGTYVVKELVYAYAMWISPSFNLQVIRAFDALVTGQIPNAAPKPKRIRKPSFDTAFARCMNVVALLPNVDENQKLLMAARGTHNLCGINPLEVVGYTALPSQTEDNYKTPTELGREFGLTGRMVNQILQNANLQVHTPGSSSGSDWSMTDRGLAYGKMFDTTRRGGKGSQQQLKWKPSVVEFLRPFTKTPAKAA